MIKYVKGDIIKVDADIIVQQCNCLSVKPLGLADYIYKKMKICPYVNKTVYRGNLCSYDEISTVGTIDLFKTNKSCKNIRYVGCLYGQFAPGKPGKYYQYMCKKKGIIETKKQRELWFRQGLENLANKIDSMDDIQLIAFPKFIGCNLAGGDWSVYERMIKEWTIENNYSVLFVEYDK